MIIGKVSLIYGLLIGIVLFEQHDSKYEQIIRESQKGYIFYIVSLIKAAFIFIVGFIGQSPFTYYLYKYDEYNEQMGGKIFKINFLERHEFINRNPITFALFYVNFSNVFTGVLLSAMAPKIFSWVNSKFNI